MAVIKNGQWARFDIDRHRTKTNSANNTTQKTKKMSNTDSSNKPGVNTGAWVG